MAKKSTTGPPNLEDGSAANARQTVRRHCILPRDRFSLHSYHLPPESRSFTGGTSWRARPQRGSWFGLPVVDERDGRNSSFVRGEIDQESLLVGRHGVLLLVRTRKRAAGNANGEQGHRSPGFQRLAVRNSEDRSGRYSVSDITPYQTCGRPTKRQAQSVYNSRPIILEPSFIGFPKEGRRR
jgi:hypothetical protein